MGLASPQLKSRHFLDFLRRCLPLSSTHDAGRALHSELRKIVLGLACPCLDWMPFVDGVTLPTIQQPSLAREAMERGCKASVLRSLSSACGFWQNVGQLGCKAVCRTVVFNLVEELCHQYSMLRYSAWSQRMPEQGTLLQDLGMLK